MAALDSRRLAAVLGCVYLAMGGAEVYSHRDDTAAALAFWGGSLLGGGLLVLVGTVARARHRPLGLALLTVGAVLGLNATLWTIVVPVLALVVLITAYREDNH